MASIGKADLIIVPKFDGLSNQVNKLLGNASKTGGQAGGQAGSAFSNAFGSSAGLAKTGITFGIFSNMASKAMDVVASHVDSAVSRLDTLKNYPQVMQSLGVSSKEAQTSIDMMSDRLSTLPTRLDAMSQTVQGLYAATKDSGVSLTQATKAGLALNDMLLAGGQSTAVVSAAAEQFRQMLAKGKPDMQDWRSLLSAAPGQMDQLAKSMLGATATTDQLYYALGGGNEKLAAKAGFDYATLSVQDLLNALVQLDSQGGAGLDSFAKQAEKAQGGIQTSMANLSNAVTKGLANVMDSVGRENIVGVINDAKGFVNDAFSGLADLTKEYSPDILDDAGDAITSIANAAKSTAPIITGAVKAVMPSISGVFDTVKSLSTGAGPLIAGVAGFKSLSGVFGVLKNTSLVASNGLAGVASNLNAVADVFGSSSISGSLATKIGSLSTALGGVGGPAIVAGFGSLAAMIGLVATKYIAAGQAQNDFAGALSDMRSLTAQQSYDAYAQSLNNVGQSAIDSTTFIAGLAQNMREHNQVMEEADRTASATIGTWQNVQETIDTLSEKVRNGQSLTKEEQGQVLAALKTVNDATGEQITMEDFLTGSFQDQAGAAQDLKGYIDALAQAKIAEAKTNALSSKLSEAYKEQYDTADKLTEAQAGYNKALKATQDMYGSIKERNPWMSDTDAWNSAVNQTGGALTEAQKSLDAAKESYDAASNSVSHLTGQMGDLAEETANVNDQYTQFTTDPLISSTFKDSSNSVEDFVSKLRVLGADTDQLKQKLSDPAVLAQLKDSFDGTAASVAIALDSMGIKMNDAGTKLAENAQGIKSALDGMDVGDSLSKVGTDAQNFANQLSDAGVTAQQMSGITGSAFSAMANAAGGDMQKLVGYIQNYNSTPIVDKNGNVSVDTTTLLDAQGNVYTWNGTQLVDKDGNVVVNGIDELSDADGNIVSWNGQQLEKKEGDVSVDFGDLIRAAALISTFNGSPVQSQSATVNVNAEQVQTAHQLGIDFNGDPVHDQTAAMIVEYASLVGANDAKVQYFAQQLQDQTATDSVTYDTVPGATWANQLHNGTGLTSFGATDSVEYGTVPAAAGANMAYNGAPPSNFSATSSVESGSVPIATNNNRNYNSNQPQNFSANSSVSSNASGATSANKSYNNNPPKNFSAVTTITRNLITNTIHNIITRVLGGGNARGGVVAGKGHAAGAIFTGKTWIDNQNYIGENGAEYYDGAHIVPLTNRQYSQPFADIIAEGITRRLGDSKSNGTTYNVYIDGARVNDNAAIESAFMGFMGELIRIREMA